MDETTSTCYGTVGSLNEEPPMRFVLPLMFSLVVSVAPLTLSASRLLAGGALLMAAATAPALAQQRAAPGFAAATAQGEGKIHELRASPTTVHRGFFDASLKPVLTIDSGDIVRLWTTT